MNTSFFKRYSHRCQNIVRYEGARFLPFHAIQKILSPFGVFGMTSLFQIDLSVPIGIREAAIPLNISLAGESDLKQAAAIQHHRDPHALYREFLHDMRHGQICFLGKVGEEIVHYNWVSLEWMESPTNAGRPIPLKQGDAYFRNSFTAEAWRRKGIFGAVRSRMIQYLQENGFKKAYTFIDINNRPSRRAQSPFNIIHSGTIAFFTPRNADRSWVWMIKGKYPWKDQDTVRARRRWSQ